MESALSVPENEPLNKLAVLSLILALPFLTFITAPHEVGQLIGGFFATQNLDKEARRRHLTKGTALFEP